MHAVFERAPTMSAWSIKASFLKENLDFFSPKIEQLDLFYNGEHMTFLSFTTKVVTDKKEVLRQPLKTTVNVNKGDFATFEVEEGLHVVISVKDFKTIVTHADSMDADLRAIYSKPGRPLQFSYEKPGFICKFTLMTTSNNTGMNAGTPAVVKKASRTTKPAQPVSNGASSRQASISMPPPSRVDGRRSTQSLGRRQPESNAQNPDVPAASQSLFIPIDDDDRAWDPTSYDDEEEVLAWDSKGADVSCACSHFVANVSRSHYCSQIQNLKDDSHFSEQMQMPIFKVYLLLNEFRK
jgi:cell cycle checkpoint control protein RAD9A